VVRATDGCGKTSDRRPCATSKEEQDLRWAYATGAINFDEYEKRYKELKEKGLIYRKF